MSVVFPTSLRSLETAEASTSEANRHECWVNSSLEPGGGTWAEVRVLMASGDACLSYQLFNRKSLNMYCELCTRHWLTGTWELSGANITQKTPGDAWQGETDFITSSIGLCVGNKGNDRAWKPQTARIYFKPFSSRNYFWVIWIISDNMYKNMYKICIKGVGCPFPALISDQALSGHSKK